MAIPKLKHGDVLKWDNNSFYLFLSTGDDSVLVPVRMYVSGYKPSFAVFHKQETKEDKYKNGLSTPVLIGNVADTLELIARKIKEKLDVT